MHAYHDFILSVTGTPGNYFVSASAPGSIDVPPEPFIYQPSPELAYELERVRNGDAPTKERMQEIGGLLFNALFTRRISRAFGRSYNSIPAGESLRLKLALQPPELAALPWELLFDPDEEVFLAARLSYPVVRHVESGIPVASPVTTQTLKVLYVQASPVDLPPLELEKSEKSLRDALGDKAEITVIRSARPEQLQQMLRQDFHILHYDGHAFFSEEQQAGAICLEDEQKNTHQVSGETLAAYLDGTSIRLVVLAACQSGMDSPEKRFSGIAQGLMKTSSLPAAIAMQFSVRDDAAISFNRGFYSALADNFPIDASVVEGRKAILQVLADDPFSAPDWATPVLFLRSKDGYLFKQESKDLEKTQRSLRRLDAAMPEICEVDKITEIRAMIALPPSKGLKNYLPKYTKSGDLISKKDVNQSNAPLDFPVDPETSKLKPLKVYLSVSSDDFILQDKIISLMIPPESDSGIATFSLTPRVRGDNLRVKVGLHSDKKLESLITSVVLITKIEAWQDHLAEVFWTIVTAPLTIGIILPSKSNEEKKMSEKPASKVNIKVGNITSSGGNVNIAAGDINQSVTNLTQNASPADFPKVLAEINAIIDKASLDPDIAEEAKTTLQSVEAQSNKEKPNLTLITVKLKNLTELIGAAAGAEAVLQQITPLIQKAVQLAQQLFHV